MANKVMLFREAGRVRRLHTVPLTQHYDVAQHSYNMAVMMYELHPDPSPPLIKACLFHDTHERLVGDAPAPVKWQEVNLASALHAIEDRVNKQLGIDIELEDVDRMWLKAMDILELYLFCHDELRMGNRNVQSVANKCHEIIYGDAFMPDQVLTWLAESSYTSRTSNEMGVD